MAKYLMHYGTKGMEWGKRLYQYKDGSLTPLGRIRYGRALKRLHNTEYNMSYYRDKHAELADKQCMMCLTDSFYKRR